MNNTRRIPILKGAKTGHLCDCGDGISLYRGVIVEWNSGQDLRVLNLLDSTPADVIDQMLVIHFHKGSISFLWKDFVPEGYEEGGDQAPREGDCWNIHESRIVVDYTTVFRQHPDQ